MNTTSDLMACMTRSLSLDSPETPGDPWAMASSDDSNDLDDGFDDEAAAAPIVYERAVDAEAAGQRLDKWLATVIPTLSRARLQQLIGEKRVSVNGQTIGEGSRRVKPGQTVRVEEPPPIAATPSPKPSPSPWCMRTMI